MFVTISFRSSLNVPRDEVEDELDSAFAEIGEVTGGGVGKSGCHFDLEVKDAVPPEQVCDRIFSTFQQLGVVVPAKIVIGTEEYHYPASSE